MACCVLLQKHILVVTISGCVGVGEWVGGGVGAIGGLGLGVIGGLGWIELGVVWLGVAGDRGTEGGADWGG